MTSARALRSVLAMIALLAIVPASSALAHGADPVGVSIVETREGKVTVRVDAPVSLAESGIDVALPDGCASGEKSRTIDRSRAIATWEATCTAPLAPRRVEVRGLVPTLDAVVRVQTGDGAVQREIVRAEAPSIEVAVRPTRLATFGAFVSLGVRHLLTGWDHILFVCGLVLLARRARSVVASLSAFTVGHSLTLAAAVLHVVSVPSKLAEIGIALSIVLLGLRAVRARAAEPPLRVALVAGTMGLLHGLGFAYALEDVGLPEGDIPLSLFGFNVGIELGQIALVAAIALGWALARRIDLARLLGRWRSLEPSMVAGYVLGGVAVMWCIDRIAALWSA